MKSILVCVSLFSFAFAESGNLPNHAYKKNEFCSPVTSGLKFCANSKNIIVDSNDAVFLEVSLTNASNQPILVKTNRDLTKYGFKVTDENGKEVLSKLDAKLKNNLMTADDQKDFLNSHTTDNRSEILKPDQVLREKILLSSIYEFQNGNKYYVEIVRKTMNPTEAGFIEIPLEKIVIEIRKN